MNASTGHRASLTVWILVLTFVNVILSSTATAAPSWTVTQLTNNSTNDYDPQFKFRPF